MNVSTAIITSFVSLICTIIASIVTFFLTRRKYNSEVDSQQIKNMSDSFDVHKRMMDEIFNTQNKKLEMLERENTDLRQQVGQLQMQMINILGSICLDATCKLRKMNFTSDLKFGDNGPKIDTPKN